MLFRSVEAVLAAVETIPAGRVVSYGDLAELIGRGGPRQVGQVMSFHGAEVTWWRVVRSDGRPARGHEEQGLALLRSENTPIRGDRVIMQQARHHFSHPSQEPHVNVGFSPSTQSGVAEGDADHDHGVLAPDHLETTPSVPEDLTLDFWSAAVPGSDRPPRADPADRV